MLSKAEPSLGRVAKEDLDHTTEETFSAQSSEDLACSAEETFVRSLHRRADRQKNELWSDNFPPIIPPHQAKEWFMTINAIKASPLYRIPDPI